MDSSIHSRRESNDPLSGAVAESLTAQWSDYMDKGTLSANSMLDILMEARDLVESQQSTSTTSSSEAEAGEIQSIISNPSVESTTPSVTGDEDLYEVLEMDTCCLTEWAALRNRKYREACAAFAVAALNALSNPKTTVAAAGHEAVAVTGGFTESYPAEQALALEVLRGRHSS